MNQKHASTNQRDRVKTLRDQYLHIVSDSDADLRDVLVALIDSGRVRPLPHHRIPNGSSEVFEITVPVEEWPRLLKEVRHPISRITLMMLLSGELGIGPIKDGCKRVTFCGTKRVGRTKRPTLPEDTECAFKQLLEYLGVPEYLGRNEWMDLHIGDERVAY